MKESDVQATMDAVAKVAADGLWYEETAFIPQQIAWSARGDFTSWSEFGGSFERPSAERVDELCANDPSLTEEMILTGIVAMRSYEEGDDAGEIAAVWKAMGAQSPVREYIAGLRKQNNRLPDPARCAVSGALLPPPNMQCLPEIPVTAEMIAAGHAIWTAPIFRGYPALWTEVYRAMAALAPKDSAVWAFQDQRIAVAEAARQHAVERIAALEAERAELKAERDIFLSHWNKAEQAWAVQKAACDQLNAQLARFTGASVPTDLPDPPRRPDGTLAPASKPWTPPKDTGDKRMVGR